MPGGQGRLVLAASGEVKRAARLDSDARRAQILAAAGDLFSVRPYGEVSTTEIAEAAGVTRGLLHHYFGSKRDLYLAVVRELVDAPVVAALDALAAAVSAGSALPGWEESVDGWMDLVEGNWNPWLVAMNAGETGQDRAMQEILDHSRERTATQVISVLGLDEERRPEVRTLVRAFGRFAEEITREWLERGRLNRAQARAVLVSALPLMVEQVLPAVAAAGEQEDDGSEVTPRPRRAG